MKCKELIEYLSMFEPEAPVGFVVLDVEKRIYHKISAYELVIDEGAIFPVLALYTNEGGVLDEIAEEIENA